MGGVKCHPALDLINSNHRIPVGYISVENSGFIYLV